MCYNSSNQTGRYFCSVLTKKEKQMIRYLNQYKDSFVTSKELATHLQCSDRTIRTYYKTLVEKLEDYEGINVISKQGHGYKLIISDDNAFAAFLEEYHIDRLYVNHNNDFTDISDRYTYLLNKLLFEQNEIYFDDLADELFVSRSTLSSDFKKIREKFKPYHLKIESKANKGVYVTGLERDKRRFIMDHFVASGFIDTMHTYVDNELLNQKISFETLTIIVLDECREGGLKLSDFVLQNLAVHIALAIRRIEEGFQIQHFEQKGLLLDKSDERRIATNILKRVSKATGITFPMEEIDYITLHLISKETSNLHRVSEDMQEQLRGELIDSMEAMHPAVKYDFQLVEDLLAHLSTMYIRLENGIVLENPLTQKIQSNYPDMYDLARKVMARISLFQSFSLTENETAYIALHLMAAQERYKEEQKYNILVICATGYGSAQMLKSRIEKELGHLISIVDVIGYYELSDDKLHGIDFVISAVDLSNLMFHIPVFTVSVFLTDDEVKTIKCGITQLTHHLSAESYHSHPIEIPIKSIFDEYFSEDSFFILSHSTKQEVLTLLAKSMVKGENEQFEDRLLDMVDKREAMSSVAFGDNVAVPHPMKSVACRHRFGVAIVKEGLQWDEQHQAIKIIFLMSMSIHDNEGLPVLTSAIIELVDNPKLQQDMIDCLTFTDFRTLFLNIK